MTTTNDPQHDLLLEVQNENRDHQPGAGHPEKRTAGRDGPLRRLRQKEVQDGHGEVMKGKQLGVTVAEWNPGEPTGAQCLATMSGAPMVPSANWAPPRLQFPLWGRCIDVSLP